jgi:hypothetical protein
MCLLSLLSILSKPCPFHRKFCPDFSWLIGLLFNFVSRLWMDYESLSLLGVTFLCPPPAPLFSRPSIPKHTAQSREMAKASDNMEPQMPYGCPMDAL